MDPRRADLHLHTCYSDGQLAPDVLVRKAHRRGLATLAITDHDTVAGVAEAQAASRKHGVEVVAGVELSTTVKLPSSVREVHLLGYLFDVEHAGLQQHLERYEATRRDRARRMARKLTGLGLPLGMEDVLEQAGRSRAVSRPHVAQALVAAGHAADVRTVFDKYLYDGGPADVSKPVFPAAEALQLLHDAGGVGVLAHPGDRTGGPVLRHLVRAGLDGIEVVHPAHDDRLQRYYRREVRARGLLETGGSDYHGHRPDDDERLGQYAVPYACVEKMHRATIRF